MSGLFLKALKRINSRFTRINQRPPLSNLRTSIRLFASLAVLGSIYFIFAYSLFNDIWYHKLICIISTGVFVYLCEQAYFELLEKRIKRDTPGALKKLVHYYNHYKGNINAALGDTIEKCPKSNRIYLAKIMDNLQKPNYEEQMERLEGIMPSIWLKMLCRLLVFAKTNGGTASDGDKASNYDAISNNLKRLTAVVTFLNIEQDYNDAELLGMQIFVFIIPFIAIPLSKWYNTSLLIDLNIDNVYKSVQAQSLTAIMLLMSNAGALFIYWMRKLQN